MDEIFSLRGHEGKYAIKVVGGAGSPARSESQRGDSLRCLIASLLQKLIALVSQLVYCKLHASKLDGCAP